MITPADIQKKTFTKGVRGYKEDEVDSFLDLLTLDMDKLIQENNVLNENIRSLNAEIERYRSSESTIFDTLESAKALMSDISSSAEKRAEIVLKNAELDADRVQREARESVERITEEAVEMARRWEQFKTRYKNLLQNELERFENLSRDFMSEGDAHRVRFYSDTIPGAGKGEDDEPAEVSSGKDFDVDKTIIQPKRNGR
jgi:cell division initiation protein